MPEPRAPALFLRRKSLDLLICSWGGVSRGLESAYLPFSVLRPAVHSCFEAATIDPGKRALNLIGKKAVVPRSDEVLGDKPHVFL